jgi:CCR4-NOT transcription complex subunit 2
MLKAFSNTQFDASSSLALREDSTAQSAMTAGSASRQDGGPQQTGSSMPRSQTLDSGIGSSQSNAEESGPEVQDPLAHMSEIDKWGIKGLSFMMHNFGDYNALVTGSDISNLGFDLNTPSTE